MESKFQFSNPVLLQLTFKINENFKSKGETKISMEIERKEERDQNVPEALVRLCVRIGGDSDEVPFYVYAEEAAKFRWDDRAYKEDDIKKLLSQNAPALLLAYLRPIIANVTGTSPFNGYNIPFINFAESRT